MQPRKADRHIIPIPSAPATAADDGALQSGRYHNLFAERLSVNPADTHRKIEQTFQ